MASEVTAAHLADLLPRLPRLRKLYLGHSLITTLAFLAQPPMTEQLTVFRLIECKWLPLAELRHVHALRALEELLLIKSFTTPMDELSQLLHTPPSPLLPRLHKFLNLPPKP